MVDRDYFNNNQNQSNEEEMGFMMRGDSKAYRHREMISETYQQEEEGFLNFPTSSTNSFQDLLKKKKPTKMKQLGLYEPSYNSSSSSKLPHSKRSLFCYFSFCFFMICVLD